MLKGYLDRSEGYVNSPKKLQFDLEDMIINLSNFDAPEDRPRNIVDHSFFSGSLKH